MHVIKVPPGPPRTGTKYIHVRLQKETHALWVEVKHSFGLDNNDGRNRLTYIHFIISFKYMEELTVSQWELLLLPLLSRSSRMAILMHFYHECT